MLTRHLEEQESKYIVRTPYAFEIGNQKIIQGTKKGERSKPHNESTEKKNVQSTLLLNATLARGSGEMYGPRCKPRGRVAPSSNLTSYTVTTCESMDFNTFATKKRPGL